MLTEKKEPGVVAFYDIRPRNGSIPSTPEPEWGRGTIQQNKKKNEKFNQHPTINMMYNDSLPRKKAEVHQGWPHIAVL